MAESAEHEFISKAFNRTLKEFARTGLYTCCESDRKAFDFSCTLTRDQSRPLVGQTLWKHEEGIDKDIRHLLLDEASCVKVYLCRDLLKNKARVEDVLSDFRRSPIGEQIFKLRIFWLPPDFEAGNPAHEYLLQGKIKEDVYNDILLSVVFGQISAVDIMTFLRVPGYPGVNFAILAVLSESGFVNYPLLSKQTGISASKLRETMAYILGAGFADSARMESLPYLTRRGKLFLDIVRSFAAQWPQPLSPEILFILRKLNIEPRFLPDDWLEDYGRDNFSGLLYHLRGAQQNYNVNLDALTYSFVERTIRAPNKPA
jgi:hypothetical protein